MRRYFVLAFVWCTSLWARAQDHPGLDLAIAACSQRTNAQHVVITRDGQKDEHRTLYPSDANGLLWQLLVKGLEPPGAMSARDTLLLLHPQGVKGWPPAGVDRLNSGPPDRLNVIDGDMRSNWTEIEYFFDGQGRLVRIWSSYNSEVPQPERTLDRQFIYDREARTVTILLDRSHASTVFFDHELRHIFKEVVVELPVLEPEGDPQGMDVPITEHNAADAVVHTFRYGADLLRRVLVEHFRYGVREEAYLLRYRFS